MIEHYLEIDEFKRTEIEIHAASEEVILRRGKNYFAIFFGRTDGSEKSVEKGSK